MISENGFPMTISAMRIKVQTAPIKPNTGVRMSKNDPIAATTDTMSIMFLAVSCVCVMSALPRPKAFVDAAVRVFGCFGAGELLLHALHPGTERVAPAAALGLRGLQVHALGFGRGTALRVQAALWVLAFLACPCWRFFCCHD